MTHMKIIGTPLYQWEIGRQLQIIPILGMTVDFVHFSNQGDAEALSVKPKEIDGIIVADIPDILLQSGRHLVVHSVNNPNSGCVETIRDCVFPVRKRAKPSDYVYTEPEKMTWKALDERITALEESGGGVVVGRFFGKVANFLGDSQTDDAGNYKSVFFYDWLKNILGLSATNSYGYSGTTIMPVAGQNRSFLERYSSMADADLIVVWGGVNDYGGGCVLGTAGDTDDGTFYGALDALCRGLILKYPGKDILFITPTPWKKTGATVPLEEYVDAIIAVCAKYCIPVFDAFRRCNMPIIMDSGRRYTVDGLHLNDLGHEILGKSVANFILYSEMAGAQEGFQTVAVTGVSIDKSAVSVEVGESVQLTATVEPSDASNKSVVWSTNKTDVATVANGLVTGVADGTATITAKTVSGNKTATCTVTVGDGQGETSVSVTGVTIDKGAHSLNVGESVQLTATVSPSDATNKNVLWSASNGNCTVSNGLVTAVTAGDCTITATTEDGGFTASCAVAVSEPAADAPASPIDGKTVTFTNPNNAGGNTYLTMLIDSGNYVNACKSGDTEIVATLVYSDATKTLGGLKGLQGFSDETGEVNNGKFKTAVTRDYMTSTVSGNTIVTTARSGNVTSVEHDYVKLAIGVSVSEYPVSFKVDSLTLKVGEEYIPIRKVGSFFAAEGYSEN